MPSRPQNLDTLHLVLELLKRIPKRSKISTSDLHKQLLAAGFDRDVRTIQRQLDELTQHFGIERDTRSKPYGYQWKESAGGMAVQQLSEQEALLLTLAEQQLRSLLPATVMRSMGGFFDEARATLRYGGHAQPAKLAKEWLKKVRVVSQTQPLLPPSIDPDVLATVSQTLYDNHYLDVSYQNAKGGITKARVMPLGLAQQGVRLYLVCRFEGFDNERSLALHRLQSAVATGLPFERPDDFSLEAFDNDGRFGFGSGEFIDLHFRITQTAGLHLLETPLSADQMVREVTVEGVPCYEIKARLVKTQQLIWWLRGFGTSVVIISPAII
jgi:predicted DNA-binding transcriptional regulator YafY